MAWQNEIKDAVYTSPSGREFIFHYGALKSETDLKTSTFTFPETDGALVVPLGVGGRRFPMSCTFYGDDCLRQATAFEEGLKERGYGELQHPIYGIHKVVPTGSISRSDNLVDGLNVSTVEVTFSETIIDETFPDSKIVTEDIINNSLDSAFADIAAEAAKDFKFDNVNDKITAQVDTRSVFKKVADYMAVIAKESAAAYTQFQSEMASAEKSVNNFVSDTSAAVSGIMNLMRIPSKLCIRSLTKVEAYATLIDDLVTTYKKDPIGRNAMRNQAVLATAALEGAITACLSGVCLSMNGSGELDGATSPSKKTAGATFCNNTPEDTNEAAFKSREDAVNTAEQIAGLYDKIIEFIDAKADADLYVQTGEGLTAMHDIVIKGLQFIVYRSFDMDIRKEITLVRDRQVMELIAELYGDFTRLDEFIVDNNLTVDEIALLPMGRKVAYYV